MADKWEIYRDKADEYRWRRTAPNGNIVGASCEGYKNRSDCVENARRHGYEGGSDKGKNDRWEFWVDNAGKHRWKRFARNGEQVGASTEGYSNKSDCEANAKRNGWEG